MQYVRKGKGNILLRYGAYGCVPTAVVAGTMYKSYSYVPVDKRSLSMATTEGFNFSCEILLYTFFSSRIKYAVRCSKVRTYDKIGILVETHVIL